jgi:hypothetical protein
MNTNFSEENHQQLGALRADVENVKDDISGIKDDVREMRDILLKAQGGWKTLVVFGTLVAGLTTGLVKLISWLWPMAQK